MLLKKAAVDKEFRHVLLENPELAAGFIGLILTPTEYAVLKNIPTYHINTIIDQIVVPQEQRFTFLGMSAVAMLAELDNQPALEIQPEPEDHLSIGGVRPDLPEDDDVPLEIHPDVPIREK